jgi:site-specific DNA-methyltransferase (adenine-specific)
MMKRIIHGECGKVLSTLPRGFARLLYIDPPFNTGRAQKRERIRVKRDASATRKGFAGATFAVERVHDARSFDDAFDDFTEFLLPRVQAALPCLTEDASIFVHLDAREVHYVKVALDALLGRASFKNEIIWAYDYGGRPKNRWPPKHDTILWYARDPDRYVFHYDAIDRIPYMAPGLVGKEKAARGKVPTDVWWNTIVPTNGKEKTGYPTQKPLAILERIVRVHSSPSDVVLDFFAGSGTTGEAAAKLGRGFVLVDQSKDAITTMRARLAKYGAE